MPTPRKYIRASVLDRLIDLEPKSEREFPPLRAQRREEFLATLHRDLGWLLNTRCPLGIAELARRERSILDYGIPDFGTFFLHNPEDLPRLETILEDTLRAYEPRLQEVKVRLELDTEHSARSLKGWLEARVVIDAIDEPLAFPIVVDTRKRWDVQLGSPDGETA